jgi:hypothetical protein
MTEFFSDLNKKSDEELIAIANGKIPYPLSAKSTTTGQDVIIEAKTILHKRQKKRDKSTAKMTLAILVFTVLIAFLTGILVYFGFCDRLIPKLTETIKSSEPKPFSEKYKNTDQTETTDKK